MSVYWWLGLWCYACIGTLWAKTMATFGLYERYRIRPFEMLDVVTLGWYLTHISYRVTFYVTKLLCLVLYNFLMIGVVILLFGLCVSKNTTLERDFSKSFACNITNLFKSGFCKTNDTCFHRLLLKWGTCLFIKTHCILTNSSYRFLCYNHFLRESIVTV